MTPSPDTNFRSGSGVTKRGVSQMCGSEPTRNLFLKIRNIASHRTQISSISLAVPAQHRGAFRDRHERRVGMRWTRAARLTSVPTCGRRSRVVLTPRRWRQVGERNFTGDGGKQARSPRRARNKLLKPSRAGMPGDPGELVVTNACAYYTSRTRLRVQRAPGIPRSPLGVAPLPS